MQKAEMERNRDTDRLIDHWRPLKAGLRRPPVPRASLPSQLRQSKLIFLLLAAQCVLTDILPLGCSSSCTCFSGCLRHWVAVWCGLYNQFGQPLSAHQLVTHMAKPPKSPRSGH